MKFDSHFIGGVRIAVALINSLSPGAARGRSFSPPTDPGARRLAVARALALDGGNPQPGDPDASGFGRLAAQLRPVFTAAEDGNMDHAVLVVNALLRQSGAAPRLDRHGEGPWHLHFHGKSTDLVTSWKAGCATALAVALGGAFATRLGVCGASSCDRVFFDESRNGSRRYCSLACQNRTKATAHRARRPSKDHAADAH